MAPNRPSDPEGFAKALSSALMSAGWTQQRLADEVGVSKQAVNKWLSGRSAPEGVDTAHRIEAALGVGLAHHLGYRSSFDDERAWNYDDRIAALPEHIRAAIDVLLVGEERIAARPTSQPRRRGRR